MVAEQRGFVARKVRHAEVAENVRKVGEPSLGVLVDDRNLVTDGLKKAVGSRRAEGRVITGVEQKEKFKGEEQLGSLVKECVAKVEGELQKRNREIQMVTEAGETGMDLFPQTVVEDGDEMDRNQVMENNESVGGPFWRISLKRSTVSGKETAVLAARGVGRDGKLETSQ